ncbi:MAG: 5-formyltetrahydrofolate cyclo-ligase [Mycobacterium sp.]
MNSEKSRTLSAAETAQHRERIWSELAKVARPDSRFHWDFSSFIADFDGSDTCARKVTELDVYQDGGLMFITPDNSTEAFRLQAMRDERPFLMTTYGLVRGFLYLEANVVPEADRRYAATLDGMDRYARPVTLAEIEELAPITLLVTGGSAVSANGVRFGKGHGYFDLEWAMLSEIGRVDDDSQIVDVVHDCQVVDEVLVGEEHDVPVDWIVTPTMATRVRDSGRQLGRVRWEMLHDSPLRDVEPMRELRHRGLLR